MSIVIQTEPPVKVLPLRYKRNWLLQRLASVGYAPGYPPGMTPYLLKLETLTDQITAEEATCPFCSHPGMKPTPLHRNAESVLVLVCPVCGCAAVTGEETTDVGHPGAVCG